MSEANVSIAEAYYKALASKDIQGAQRYLHPDIQFVGPMGESKGRDAVVEAAIRLIPLIKSIDVRAKFSSGDQVVLVYNLMLTGPVDRCPTAVLMTFKDGLIVRTELFYDARPFGNL